ncbi:hypothetical protein DES45_101515 [Microvirga subterranea]|uniref:Uncharacterized protein n=1 Tax=Microvirga subterranea TaxID=186651 RepID=A0A370HUR2_9HYPH|nr:hypothetical protein DES45_101515 [Microvirga subterranea]
MNRLPHRLPLFWQIVIPLLFVLTPLLRELRQWVLLIFSSF